MRLLIFCAGALAFACCTLSPAFAGRFGGGGFGGGGFGGGGFGGGGFGGGGGRMGGGGFGGGGHIGGGGFSRPAGGIPMSRPSHSVRPASSVSRPSVTRPVTHSSVHSPYAGGPHMGGNANRPTPSSIRTAINHSQFGPGSGVSRPGGGGAGERHVWDTPRGGKVIAGGDRGPFGGSGAYIYSGPHGSVRIGGGKGGSISGPGGGGIAGGKSGHVTIGPNGNIHASGTKAGSVVGPGGKAVAGGAHGAATIGPNGAAAHGGRAGIATGPGGAIAGGVRAGIATGPGGTIVGGSRGAIAVGPNGAVAGGGRFVAGSGAYGRGIAGTRFVAASDLRGQGAYVRSNFRYYNSFTPGWYNRHPGAWFAAGWVAGGIWNSCSWSDCSSYCGYPEDTSALYYNYGDNVTYEDGNVYYDGDQYATEQQYYEQAATIAASGQDAKPAQDDKWQALGVFAMVKGDETSSSDIFQLAVNKDGVLRGNYYNATTDATTPVTGSLDKKTQRLAWNLDGQPNTVYDTGLYNLTLDETTMLVHFGKDRTEQYKLFRIQQSDDGASPAGQDAPAAKGISR